MQQMRTTGLALGILAGVTALAFPVTEASAQDTSGQAQAKADSQAKPDSMWGYTVDTTAAQNPQGYRGMERPSNVVPADSEVSGRERSPEAVEGRVTGAYSDSSWQDTSATRQNPPGYRGMERPVGQDTSNGAAAGDADSTRVGEDTPKAPKEATNRLHPGGDTAAQAGVSGAAEGDTATDTTGMTGRRQSDSTENDATGGEPADSGR